jgi:hypothetical protein
MHKEADFYHKRKNENEMQQNYLLSGVYCFWDDKSDGESSHP